MSARLQLLVKYLSRYSAVARVASLLSKPASKLLIEDSCLCIERKHYAIMTQHIMNNIL